MLRHTNTTVQVSVAYSISCTSFETAGLSSRHNCSGGIRCSGIEVIVRSQIAVERSNKRGALTEARLVDVRVRNGVVYPIASTYYGVWQGGPTESEPRLPVVPENLEGCSGNAVDAGELIPSQQRILHSWSHRAVDLASVRVGAG